jgi:excisionase family DNA binding protein
MSGEILRADQVEKRLSCSRSMVHKLIKQGKLDAFKLNSEWRIYAASVKRYISSHSSHTSHNKQ